LKKPLPLRLRIRKGMFDRKLYGRIYGVGIPALNMALPSLMITALNGILASFSAVYVLVLGIYYKLQTL
ncbi:MATE family efflux transporter, partial [Lacrimispora saccharolytica]|nr:MATE family efflux transporter [Lacrimispora saccharolytica]